jgi:hypothetical protein
VSGPGPRALAAFAGGILLAALLSPFVLDRVVDSGLPANSSVPGDQVFLVLAAMTVVLNLVLAAGFLFRGWKALAWGVLAGVVATSLLTLLR